MNRDELIEVLRILLVHVAEAHQVSEVGLDDVDNYWTTSSDSWLDMSAEPNVVVGSLVEDVTELKLLLDDPKRASILNLERFASVVRYLSDQVLR